MRETAAGERNHLFLAAVVVGEDDAPTLATNTATPENTTSGGLIWSAPTTCPPQKLHPADCAGQKRPKLTIDDSKEG